MVVLKTHIFQCLVFIIILDDKINDYNYILPISVSFLWFIILCFYLCYIPNRKCCLYVFLSMNLLINLYAIIMPILLTNPKSSDELYEHFNNCCESNITDYINIHCSFRNYNDKLCNDYEAFGFYRNLVRNYDYVMICVGIVFTIGEFSYFVYTRYLRERNFKDDVKVIRKDEEYNVMYYSITIITVLIIFVGIIFTLYLAFIGKNLIELLFIILCIIYIILLLIWNIVIEIIYLKHYFNNIVSFTENVRTFFFLTFTAGLFFICIKPVTYNDTYDYCCVNNTVLYSTIV